MPRHLSLLFPGQGSQSIGMLKSFNSEDISEISSISSDIFDFDLVDIIKNGPDELLNKTSVTQPAILATSYLYYKKFKSITTIVPDILAGHSLGEYSALVASNSLDIKKALNIVYKRGKFMENCPEGSMYAILNLDIEIINNICRDISKSSGNDVSPANINSENQIVIAGHHDSAQIAADECKKAGAKRCVKLNVSVASHCVLMDDASKLLEKELINITFAKPLIPVIHNIDGLIGKDSNNISVNLTKQLTSPVQWLKTMKHIKDFDGIIIECGPGRVLSSLAKANGLDNILSMSSENFEEEFYNLT